MPDLRRAQTVRFAPLWSRIGIGAQQHRYPQDAQRRLPRHRIRTSRLAAKDGLITKERNLPAQICNGVQYVYLQGKLTAAQANERASELVFVSGQGPRSSIPAVPANANMHLCGEQNPVGRAFRHRGFPLRHLQCTTIHSRRSL